jgi:hypothetical protein
MTNANSRNSRRKVSMRSLETATLAAGENSDEHSSHSTNSFSAGGPRRIQPDQPHVMGCIIIVMRTVVYHASRSMSIPPTAKPKPATMALEGFLCRRRLPGSRRIRTTRLYRCACAIFTDGRSRPASIMSPYPPLFQNKVVDHEAHGSDESREKGASLSQISCPGAPNHSLQVNEARDISIM